MKRKITLLLVCMLLVLSCQLVAAADSEIALREGRYIVGEDIDPGKYILTCTATTTGQIGDAYGALGNAIDSFGGTSGFGNLFNAFGGLMEEISGVTVQIIGNYGDVLASRELKEGETVQVNLKTGTALKISDGTCTLAVKK